MAVKKCTKCGEEKPLSAFGNYKRTKDGLQRACTVCLKAMDRAYKSTPAEKLKNKQRLTAWRLKNPEKFLAQQRRHEAKRDQAAREAYRKSPERRMASAKIAARWRKNNTYKWHMLYPERANANTAARKARKLKATPSWANKFFIGEVYALAKDRSRKTTIGWHVDHIVPLANKLVCGLHCEHNLRVIPAKENHVKNNKFWPDMP